MEITSQQVGSATIVKIMGNFDATTSQQATDFFMQEIESGHVHLVIDFSQINYLSSAGVRSILAARHDARTAGGDIRLAAAVGNIKRVIDIAGFTKIMKYFPTVDEAVGDFD